MRTPLACLLAATLAACTVPGTPGGQGSPKPKPSTEVKPAGTASPGAQALQLLQKPAGASTVLSGTLRIDASYAYNGGLGKLISNDGGGLITNDGAGLIGNDGAGLIGNDGASIAITSGALISQDGGGLITNDGAGIVAQGAGNLISKRKYGLTSTSGVKMAVGTLLRAANMQIQVTNTATGEVLALGEDGAKNKIYAITTNAGGAYTVYLPAGVDSQNLRISAVGLGLDDARLAYQLLVPNQASSTANIDEDTALVTRYLRGTFGARIDQTFGDADGTGGSFLELVAGTALAPVVAPIGEKIGQASLAAKTSQYTPDRRRAMGLACADAIMSAVDLPTVTTLDGKGLMMDEMLAVLRDFRAAAEKKMHALGAPDPAVGYFTNESWYQKANAERMERDPSCAKPYAILTPKDLAELVLDEILTSHSHKQQFTIYDVFKSVDFPDENGKRLNNALSGFYAQVFLKLQPEEEGKDSLAMRRLLTAIAKPPSSTVTQCR